LVIEQGVAHEQPEHSEQTELPSRGCSGCSDCSGCSVADNHPRNSLETEQPEHPSTRARVALGLRFGAQVALGAHELTRAQNGFLMLAPFHLNVWAVTTLHSTLAISETLGNVSQKKAND